MTTDASPTPVPHTDDLEQLRDWLIEEADTRGNAVVSVAPEDGVGGYCFTAGAWRKHGVPEAVVVGLPEQIATVLLDAYVDKAAMGVRFEPGVLYDGFFDGIPVAFEHVDPAHYPAYFGSAFVLYPDGDFPGMQIIVPTPEGSWPWDDDAPEGFAQWQPLLNATGTPSF
ncbi:DUF4262 domain-containing protein [Haloechinothrix halophila]|uniref:DUF4262 domain-containing protein n=1 Tax=Haloechinothrix halophila TaxID=1069073 RepID=UPI000416A1DD|nr:DUF4262 domain-containing protein [Haloechinothrix halophila]